GHLGDLRSRRGTTRRTYADRSGGPAKGLVACVWRYTYPPSSCLRGRSVLHEHLSVFGGSCTVPDQGLCPSGPARHAPAADAGADRTSGRTTNGSTVCPCPGQATRTVGGAR